MSEQGWSSDAVEATPPKRRVPGWVWGCGAGCALVLIVGVLALWLAFNAFSKAFDQDVQWERVSQVLPFDQRPAGVHVFAIPIKVEGITIWVMTDQSRGHLAVLFSAPPGESASETKRELFDASGHDALSGPLGNIEKSQIEPGRVVVATRELTCVRFNSTQEGGGSSGGWPFTQQANGATIAVDLSPEHSDELLALMLIKLKDTRRVSDEELREFLAPFRIPGGEPPAPPADTTPPADPAAGKEDR